MNITPETVADLRRLHADYETAKAEDGDNPWPIESRAVAFRRRAMEICAGANLRPLLDELEAVRAERDRLRAALTDMRGGWRYIRQQHGDLSGVGWDRCEASANTALGDSS